MREFKEHSYLALDSFLVRTPLLPCETEITNAKEDTDLIDTAILVASSSLYQALKSGRLPKSNLAVDRYLNRMAYRPTPFGMFAGVSIGHFEMVSDLSRDVKQMPKTVTRPDMSWVVSKLINLSRDRVIRRSLRLFRNEAALVKDNRIWLETVSVQITPAISMVMQKCSEGIMFSEVTNLLHMSFNSSVDEAEDLLNELCDLNILYTELQVPYENWRSAIETLSKVHNSELAAKITLDIEQLLKKMLIWDMDENKSPQALELLFDYASNIAGKDHKDLLQVDAHMPLAKNGLNAKIGEEIATGVELLFRLSTSRNGAVLDHYARQFRSRYKEGREVPLLELINPIFGIGSPYRLGHSQQNIASVRTKRTRCILRMINECLEKGTIVFDLTNQDLVDLEIDSGTQELGAPTLDVLAEIEADSYVDIDKGDFKLFISSSIGCEGGGRILGRFAHVLGDEASELLSKVRDFVECPSETIHANVTCWVEQQRLANVTMSPLAGEFIVSYGCSPISNTDAIVIPVSEINIGLRDGKFYARWIRTGQEIQTRSTHMLNPSYMPDAVRMLLDISSYGRLRLQEFDWGIGNDLEFTPRLTYGRIVLSCAKWKLRRLAGVVNSFDEFEKLVNDWRRRLSVPRFIRVAENSRTDNYLVIDLDSNDSLRMLHSTVKQNNIENMLAYEHTQSRWHSTGKGQFCTELAVTLVRTDLLAPNRPLAQVRQELIVNPKDYLRTPGSDWTYLVIRANRAVHHKLISELAEQCGILKQTEVLKKWFFVPYCEQDDQLRIRLQAANGNSYSAVIPMICSWAGSVVDRGLSPGFSIETYNREIERYGGLHAINLAEEIFNIDSELTASIFQIQHNCLDLADVVIGVLTIYCFLSVFEQNDTSILSWVKTVRGRSADPQILSQEFRTHKSILRDLFLEPASKCDATQYAEVLSVLPPYRTQLEKFARRYQMLESANRLTEPFWKILDSFVHLHCIRLFGIDRPKESLARGLLERAINMRINAKRLAS